MNLISFERVEGQRCSPNAKALLRIEGVSVRLGQRLVLDNTDMEIFEGEQIRIIGTNGSGKSTLLNAIAGIVPLERGRIVFRGEDISNLPVHERAQMGIAYMRQRANVFTSLTVRENFQLALGSNGYIQFSKRYPEWVFDLPPDKLAGILSGGQKQKLAWGLTILGKWFLLLLDEPRTGMAVRPKIERLGQESIIFVEHD